MYHYMQPHVVLLKTLKCRWRYWICGESDFIPDVGISRISSDLIWSSTYYHLSWLIVIYLDWSYSYHYLSYCSLSKLTLIWLILSRLVMTNIVSLLKFTYDLDLLQIFFFFFYKGSSIKPNTMRWFGLFFHITIGLFTKQNFFYFDPNKLKFYLKTVTNLLVHLLYHFIIIIPLYH